MIICKNETSWVSHCEHKNTRSRVTRREAPDFWHTLLPRHSAHDWAHHFSHVIPARNARGSSSPPCWVWDPSFFPLPVENSYSHIHFLGWSTHIPLLRRYSSPYISDIKTELHIKHHGRVWENRLMHISLRSQLCWWVMEEPWQTTELNRDQVVWTYWWAEGHSPLMSHWRGWWWQGECAHPQRPV